MFVSLRERSTKLFFFFYHFLKTGTSTNPQTNKPTNNKIKLKTTHFDNCAYNQIGQHFWIEITF